MEYTASHTPAGRAQSSDNAKDFPLYAALDLGTNNCRLLIARGLGDEFTPGSSIKVVDGYSRIVRLGEGVGATGKLSEAAMERTIQALRQCKAKLDRYSIAHGRFVATEACRRASNTKEFLTQVARETGITIDIITNEEEARLAFLGCSSLLEPDAERGLIFDIGGGSTECMWVDLDPVLEGKPNDLRRIRDWSSVPYGVMNLSERAGGNSFTEMYFDEMVEKLADALRPFDKRNEISGTEARHKVQMLSTSGTVTTLAAIHLDLPRYDRSKVDGIKLRIPDIKNVIRRLLDMRPSERFHHPCIGPDRADYIISGCVIFEAISRVWPLEHVTIADRGVREGIILSLMNAHSHD